jgi:hypothetical protein
LRVVGKAFPVELVLQVLESESVVEDTNFQSVRKGVILGTEEIPSVTPPGWRLMTGLAAAIAARVTRGIADFMVMDLRRTKRVI